jgi:hypothetical protein
MSTGLYYCMLSPPLFPAPSVVLLQLAATDADRICQIVPHSSVVVKCFSSLSASVSVCDSSHHFSLDSMDTGVRTLYFVETTFAVYTEHILYTRSHANYCRCLIERVS